MTVENTGTVDAVGTDKETGEVRLSIVDHLHWDAEHLCLLQKKINGYLDFIVSGGIYASYPDAKGRPLVIDVYTKFRPTEGAERSLLDLTSTGGMAQPLRACENRMGRADRGHSYQPAAGRRAQVGADRDHLLRVAFAGVITLTANALWRGLRKDHQEEQFRERALSRRMREFVDQTLPI